MLAETRPAGEIARVEVDPGDGSGAIVTHTGQGWIRASPKHSYTRPGRFTARITLMTTDGQSVSARTRITVVPDKPADPSELLVVVDARGDAPHTATFKIGGNSLPFTARAARLGFGDGQAIRVLPFQTITHTYSQPGRYLAKLEFRGNDGNRARAARDVTVDDAPRLRFTVAPTSGIAPVEVTVRANIPRGDIHRAGVLQNGSEIIGTQQLVRQAEGRRKITLSEPGTYNFELRAITENGERYREMRTVVVRRGELAQGDTYYEHDGGVVQIVQSGGSFEGTMRAPTVDQALAGYDIGQVFVRGAFADRAYSALRPLNYDDPNSERRRYYEDHAVQVAGGSYKVLSPNCPPQWGDYGFNVAFDPERGQATSISGSVVFKDYMTRAERAYARARQPMPRAGIIGRLTWVAEMMSMMRRYGDDSANPDECVTSDAPDTSRPAVFTRISLERAQEIARENINNTRGFAQRAYDGFDGPPPDDGTPRMTDPTYGEAPSSEDPVYLASGEFYETSVDLIDAAANDLGWRFQRTYRSQSPVHTSLGHGWVHNYQLALVRVGDSWRYRDENGGHEVFRSLSDGLFQSAKASRLRITQDLRVIRTQDGTLYNFVPTPGLPDQSRLESIASPNGSRLLFSYDLAGRLVQVEDGNGRKAHYSYDDDRGYLLRVDAPDGSAVRFAHGADGNLVSISAVHPETGETLNQTRYTYRGNEEGIAPELRHNMVQVWLADGGGQQSSLDIEYGEEAAVASFDRVVSQRTGDLIEQFEYGRISTAGGERFTTRLMAEGRAEELHIFTDTGRHERTVYAANHAEEIAIDLLYDAQGKPAGRRYPSGATFEITPGPADGLVVETRTPAAGSKLPPTHWVIQSEPIFGRQKAIFGPFTGAIPDTVAAVEEKRRITRIFDYEEAGSGANNVLVRFGYGGSDPALGDVNGDGRTDQAGGRLIKVIRHSLASDPTSTIHIWNDGGSLAQSRHEDGSVTRFNYSDAGNLVQVTSINQQGSETIEAQYDWDASGALVGARTGDVSYIGIERDALGRMIKTTQAGHPSRSFQYDAMDRIIVEMVGDKKLAEYDYDAFGRVVAVRRWPDSGDPIVETYTYDAFGRVISAADPAGTWSREIDLLGRTVSEVLPNGEKLSFSYNIEGRLIRETGLGWSHDHAYDGFGRHVETVTQSGDTIAFAYDDESRPVSRTVRRGGNMVSKTHLKRDADGNLVGVGAAMAEDTLVALPLGPETVSVGVKGPALISGTPQRDLMGRITEFRGSEGAFWQLGWDTASRLTSLTRDGTELLSAVFAPEDPSLAVQMFGFAPLQISYDGLTEIRVDGRGSESTILRDAYGRPLAEHAVLADQSAERTYAYDGAGRMVEHQRDETKWTRQYEGVAPVRDTLSFGDGESYSIARHYDELGRLAKRTLPSGTTIIFSYPSAASVEVSVGDDVIVLSYTPDGAIERATLGQAEVQYTLPIFGAAVAEFKVSATGPEGNVVDRTVRFENGLAISISEPLTGLSLDVERDDSGRIISVGEDKFRYSATGAMISGNGELAQLPAHATDAALATLDPDGRVAEVAGLAVSRDAFGLISGATRDGRTSSYLRDGQGRVVAITTDEVRNDIVYDSGTVTGLYRGGNRVYEYVLDANNVPIARISDAGLQLLALNFGGGALAYIAGDGAVGTRISLSAFGVPDISSNEFDKLTDPMPLLHGLLYDPASRLYLTSVRSMDSEIGQFLSPEPLGPLASALPFEYAAGDPFTYRDVTGTIPTGSGGVNPDASPGERFSEAVREPWERASEALEENLGDQNGSANDGSDNSGGRGDTPGATTGGDGNSQDGSRYPGINRDYEAEEEAADRRARIAEIEARQRAEKSAFKRNTRFAHQILPEEVRRLWLDSDDTMFGSMYKQIYQGETVPWGTPATGPSVGNEGDPHALLRATLTGKNAPRGRTGERLRFLFRDQLSVPSPVAPPSTQINPSPRPAPPGRQPGGMSSIGGGSQQPETSPTQPIPAKRKKPTGLSNIGGLF